MRKFRVRIVEAKGKWFFRWDNVHVPTACGVSMPLCAKRDAESQMQQFMETERSKYPWTVFEPDGSKAVVRQTD